MRSIPPSTIGKPRRRSTGLLAWVVLVGVTLHAGAAGAISKAKRCRQACAGIVAACSGNAAASGFGDLGKACAKAALKRCRREGPSACETFCGNAHVDGQETCDGADLAGNSCTALGFEAGDLACTAGCELDVRGCQRSSGQPAATCGNGIAETGEECDGADLRSRTCASSGFFPGALACSDSCQRDTSGCTRTRFVDNGDGTLTDNQTGLQWEMKDYIACLSGGLHCVSHVYSFIDAVSDFIPRVNEEGLGGAHDWRLPTFDELVAIRDCSASSSCIDPAFSWATVGEYWSGENCCCVGGVALFVTFDPADLVTGCGSKTTTRHVRAVRALR